MQDPPKLGDALELFESFSTIQCTLHMIRKQYTSTQGCDGEEVPYRDFVQQETDLCQLSGHRKRE